MQTFTSDGLELAYLDEGEQVGAGGAPGSRLCLLDAGELGRAGLGPHAEQGRLPRRRLRSSRPRPAAPSRRTRRPTRPQKMAGDAVALLDHLGSGRPSLFGYSMGARVSAFAALAAAGALLEARLRRPRHRPRRGRRRLGPDRRGAAGAVDRRRRPTRAAACSAPSPTAPAATDDALAACISTSRQELTAEDESAGSPSRR